MDNIPEIFGSMVFNDKVMKARLPEETYKTLKKSTIDGTPLELDVANIIAGAMKDWALEKGATHFTHWFQPMTGITAEKHDSFIFPAKDGTVIMEFSGKALVCGEPDASSFPSGGLRATFEARGYTAWDPSSHAFIKDGTLCIPTAFCSYSGEALDKKTPLLRSMEAIDKQAMRILRLFNGDDAKHVLTTVGAEQEYFLIDKSMYERRPDIIACGRTLIGAKPTKGQELEDHYYGALKIRVSEFMRELDKEMWKLGILAKTKHNEVAPAQHELAPIYTTTNISTDHNQLTMELMKKVASRHGLVCLLHEKPFAGVNGSGKHINWSISTDTGINLLEPGDTPSQNARFLLILMAIIKAVDQHQDLLRISVASAGNDHRFGANEAPPTIISIFLGDELTEIIESIENGTFYTEKEKANIEIGVSMLPKFPKDTTDRNRTSPFAFTGNKFEFRMLGASFSIADTNTALNTIIANAMCEFADALEQSENFTITLNTLVKDTIKKHKRIIFNGNNYSREWTAEAERRGLLNLGTTVDAIHYFISEKNINLFRKCGVLSESEVRSRYEIFLENYSKTIIIEALTMLDMIKREVLPGVLEYSGRLAEIANQKKAVNLGISLQIESKLINKTVGLAECMCSKLEKLEEAVNSAKSKNYEEMAGCCRDEVIPGMEALRKVVDELETLVGKKYWPYPTYSEILYSVK